MLLSSDDDSIIPAERETKMSSLSLFLPLLEYLLLHTYTILSQTDEKQREREREREKRKQREREREYRERE